MIAMAYTSTGREIKLRKAGSKRISAGSMILRGGKWSTVDKDIVVRRTQVRDYMSQSRTIKEEIHHVGL